MTSDNLPTSTRPSAKSLIFSLIAALCGIATLFFSFFGILVVYEAATFEGEGSLGHVGLYIAAGLFPFLGAFCGALTFLAWRTARPHAPRPPR